MASAGGASMRGQRATAAIDFGTSGTAAVALFSMAKNDAAPIRVSLDGRTSDGTTGKPPTAILLQAEAPHAFVAFGEDAFTRYSDFKAREEHGSYLLFAEFKMQLRPGGTRYDRGDPNSYLVGAADRTVKYKLLLPVVETLRHAKNCVLQQLTRVGGSGVAESDISWVLTVPAIWDDEARSFMRHAAELAGLGGASPESDDRPSRLTLALEPEAAAIAAVPGIRKLGLTVSRGDRVMIVDAGGGTLDINVSEVVEFDEAASAVSLSELTLPGGGPFGGTAVDHEFTKLLASCAGKKHIPPSAWMSAMRREWLFAKESYDFSLDEVGDSGGFAKRDGATYTVEVTDVLEGWGLLEDACASDLALWKDRVAAAVRRHGTVTFHDRRGCVYISLDSGVMASFFAPVIDAIGTCVQTTAALREVSGLKYIILAGGFSSSRALRRRMATLFPRRPGSPLVIQVERPSNAIADGALQYGLSPNAFVTTRLVRHSFGIIVNTKYDPARHRLADRLKFRDDPGNVSADVIKRLAAKGSRVATARLSASDPTAAVTHVWPSSTSSAMQVFQFVRTSLDLPAFNDPERVAILKDSPAGVAAPLASDGLPQTVFVPRSCVAAEVSVPLPRGMRSIDDGECIVQFHFGRTEIEAEVTVLKTGQVRRCAVKYLSDRPTSVPGVTEFDDDSDEDDDEEGGGGGGGGASGGGKKRGAIGRSLHKAAPRPGGGRRHPPSVCVKGLHPDTTEQDLQLLLSRGKVAHLVHGITIPRRLGVVTHAYVNLHTIDDAEDVILALRGHVLRGRELRASARDPSRGAAAGAAASPASAWAKAGGKGASGSSGGGYGSSSSSAAAADSSKMCVVCMSETREVMILPCKHLCLCAGCAVGDVSRCPMCRGEVREKTRVYW